MKRSVVISIIVISVFLSLIIYFGFIRGDILTVRTRASQIDVSRINSYVFVSPLQAKADNSEKIRLTFFALDDRGLGIQGRKIGLKSDANINVTSVQNTTDTLGKAVFDISSVKAGSYYPEILIDNNKSGIKAHLVFRD